MTGNRGLDGATPPPDVDLGRPSIARVHDYVLGGDDHPEIDRQVSQALFAAVPGTSRLARDDRDHLCRAVTWLVAEAGVRKILGSGLPTIGDVHETAHAVDPVHPGRPRRHRPRSCWRTVAPRSPTTTPLP